MNQIEPVFGADPEFFASYRGRDGFSYCMPPVIFRTEFGIPAEENGRHPIFLHCSNEQIVHEDGAAFELTVNPTKDWHKLFNDINSARDEFNDKILSKFQGTVDPHLKALPTIGWDVKRWKNRGEDFEMATEFGCDPDQDLFDLQSQCHVIDASKHPYRYGGGHIHMSNVAEIDTEPLTVLRMMVLAAGLSAVAYSPVPDLEKERTYLYGRPGKFRIQNYPDGTHGVEYRTPSNSWTDNVNLAALIFEAIKIGVHKLLPEKRVDNLMTELQDDVITAILSCDQEKAKSLLSYVLA